MASEESRAGVELSDECAGNETSKRIASLALAVARTRQLEALTTLK